MTTPPRGHQYLDRYGFPILLNLALAAAVWNTATWVGINVLQPIANAHVAFLATLAKTNEANTLLLHAIHAEILHQRRNPDREIINRNNATLNDTPEPD